MDDASAVYYPVMLQLKERNCYIIGGGKIATRKAQGLLECGANRITVISPTITDQLARLVAEEKLQWIQQDYDEKYTRDAFLVFAATNNTELNDRINDTMVQRGILVCNVSNGKRGSIITPAVIRGTDITIAISTGGAYPALTRMIKESIEEHVTAHFSTPLARLASIRTQIKGNIVTEQLKAAMLALALEDCLEQREINESDWFDSLLARCTKQQGMSTAWKEEG